MTKPSAVGLTSTAEGFSFQRNRQHAIHRPPIATTMRLGYVRLSTSGKTAGRNELRALEAARCDIVLIDSLSGVRSKLSGAFLSRLAEMRAGDELVVLQLDHLLPMPDLLALLVRLVHKDIVVESLTDGFTTKDLVVADLFRALGAYMTVQPDETKHRGRKPLLSEEDAAAARRMIVEERKPVTEVASALGVSRATIYRRVPLSRVDEVV